MPAEICNVAAILQSSMSVSQSEHRINDEDMQPTVNGSTNFAFDFSDQHNPVVHVLPLRSDQTTLPWKQGKPVGLVKPFQATPATLSPSAEVQGDEVEVRLADDRTAKHTNNNYDIPSKQLTKQELLAKVKERLSKARYYHGRLSTQEARFLLKNKPVGTFLVRDSESPNHMFSISSRTSRGTTSVRISCDVTWQVFELDVGGVTNSGKPITQSPRFNCVTAIVDYLIRVSTGANGEPCLCVESDGRSDTPFLLIRPLPSS